MMNELGENKITVSHFNTEVASCLEDMSKTMNRKYTITSEYHQKVMQSMEDLEQQVYKPADTSRNFLPPALPHGEKIISAMQGEIQTEEEAREAINEAKRRDELKSEEDQVEIDRMGSGTPMLAGSNYSRPRRDSGVNNG